MYPQVNITRLANQLSRQGADAGERVGALVMGGVAVAGGAQLNTVYTLYSVSGAETLGLDAAYDADNSVLVHKHIDDFFFYNPAGELHIMLVAQNTSLEDMCDPTNDYLKKVLREANGRIRKAGVVLNPDGDYTSTTSGGLDADVLAAIPKAQALADEEYGESRPINNIVIEGREFNGTVGDATDLRALANGPYRDVSVVIGQDPDVADNDALFADYAAVGAYLGMATNKTISQSFAQPIDQFNLADAATDRFLGVYLSNNQPLTNLAAADIAALSNKGYVFARTFPSYGGVYWNQSHVCAPVTDDYNYSELRDVMNQAVRLTHPVVIPYVNSTEWVVTDAGRIEKRQTSAVAAEIRSALGPIEPHVSNISYINVDPAVANDGSPYPSFLDDSTLRVQIGLRPKGKSVTINVEIGYTRQ